MSKGGPAITIFEEEYQKRFGITPAVQTPDCVQLNRALKAVGDDYRELVAFYLAKEDRFLEANGFSGRLVTATTINAFRLSKARQRPMPANSTSYKDALVKWEEENGLRKMPMLSPLGGARANG